MAGRFEWWSGFELGDEFYIAIQILTKDFGFVSVIGRTKDTEGSGPTTVSNDFEIRDEVVRMVPAEFLEHISARSVGGSVFRVGMDRYIKAASWMVPKLRPCRPPRFGILWSG